MPFALGQRWISDTETDLGLGTVVAVEGRMVTLLFPATGENRMYAKEEAPVTRVSFNVGDQIASHEDWTMTVEEVQEKDGLLIYVGVRTDNDEPVALKEVFLNNFIKFNKPQDRLFAGQIDRMSRFTLRYEALVNQHQRRRNPTRGLAGGKVSLIPHQLYIAHEVGHRYAPRVLLADEVGLGKTIEAGMIIHQQLLSGRAHRVLILLPETLQHQWLVEMLRRFNLHFSLFDEERCIEAFADAENPFETEQLVICSLDFLRKKRRRFEQVLEAEWDLLVVDEAHHLEWSEEAPSRAYEMVEALAEQVPGVLLLTATPDQLGHQSHFARLRLLDPERFYDYDAFLAEEQAYGQVAGAAQELLDGETLSDDAKRILASQLEGLDLNDAAARQQAVAKLLDQHGTGRVLFRNSRANIQGFPERHLNVYPMPLPEQYKTAIKVMGMMGGNGGDLQTRALRYLYPEKIFQQFEGDNATWTQFDPRVEWLLELLLSARQQKVLVICSEAATANALEEALRTREGIRGAVFHEGMSILERDKASAYFAQAEGGAQVLLCSEIGSEGRNFQFASHLVLFDLPLNPDLLEQRIGRLDRIGQMHDIQIMVPYLEHTAQAVLGRWFHEGLDAFEHTCPTGRTIYDSCYEQLIGYLAAPTEQEGLDEFIHACRQQHDQLKAQLEQGRDRLLEMHSNGGDKAQALAAAIAEQDNDVNLVGFALNLFDIVGINQEDRSDSLIVLTPSDHMLVPDFPGLPQDGCTVTFDRDQALSREDAQFVSWEHPIIRNGLDLILSGDTGSCAVSLLKNKALPVGTLLVELVYVVEAQAPKHLQLTRFLPPTPIRMLMDRKGTNLAAQVEFESFNRQLNAVNRHTSSKLVNAVQQDVHAMLQQAESLVEAQARQLIEQAKQEADDKLSAELARLEALKAVNPNIRDDEVETLEFNRRQVLANLNEAGWRLDAIRLVVVTHQ